MDKSLIETSPSASISSTGYQTKGKNLVMYSNFCLTLRPTPRWRGVALRKHSIVHLNCQWLGHSYWYSNDFCWNTNGCLAYYYNTQKRWLCDFRCLSKSAIAGFFRHVHHSIHCWAIFYFSNQYDISNLKSIFFIYPGFPPLVYWWE